MSECSSERSEPEHGRLRVTGNETEGKVTQVNCSVWGGEQRQTQLLFPGKCLQTEPGGSFCCPGVPFSKFVNSADT